MTLSAVGCDVTEDTVGCDVIIKTYFHSLIFQRIRIRNTLLIQLLTFNNC